MSIIAPKVPYVLLVNLLNGHQIPLECESEEMALKHALEGAGGRIVIEQPIKRKIIIWTAPGTVFTMMPKTELESQMAQMRIAGAIVTPGNRPGH